MYYLDNVDHNVMAAHLTGSDWNVLRIAVHSMHWMGLLMISCGMAVKRMGMLRGVCEEGEGSDCENGDGDTDW